MRHALTDGPVVKTDAKSAQAKTQHPCPYMHSHAVYLTHMVWIACSRSCRALQCSCAIITWQVGPPVFMVELPSGSAHNAQQLFLLCRASRSEFACQDGGRWARPCAPHGRAGAHSRDAMGHSPPPAATHSRKLICMCNIYSCMCQMELALPHPSVINSIGIDTGSHEVCALLRRSC